MEEPGGLQSMGLRRVGHNWATSLSLFTFMHWRRKWQPTPVFLPGESQGRGAWWAAIYWVAQSRTRLKWLSSSSVMEQCAVQVAESVTAFSLFLGRLSVWMVYNLTHLERLWSLRCSNKELGPWSQMPRFSSWLWYVMTVWFGANYLASKPHFPHLHNGDTVGTYLPGGW